MHVFIVSLWYCEQSVGYHIGRQLLATECPPQTRVLVPNATVEGKMMSHNKNIQEKIKKLIGPKLLESARQSWRRTDEIRAIGQGFIKMAVQALLTEHNYSCRKYSPPTTVNIVGPQCPWVSICLRPFFFHVQ